MNQFIGSLALLPFESLLNTMLKRDAYIAQKLAPFHGKYIEVLASKPDFSLILGFEDEAIKLSAIDSKTLRISPDASISAKAEKLLGLLQAGSNERALADKDINISGDGTLVQDIHMMIGSLDIDWQDYLGPLLGDILSNELGKIVDASKNWSNAASINIQRNIHDYLSEEARVVPSRLEADSTADRLDQLRLQIDRATAKTELLARRLTLLSKQQ